MMVIFVKIIHATKSFLKIYFLTFLTLKKNTMKSTFLITTIFLLNLNVIAQLNNWQAFTDSIPTLSSPRSCDLNQDGIDDIVIGGGTDGVYSNNGIMAYNGLNGSLLWKRPSRNEVFGSAIFQDITGDGIKDVFITGRQAQLLAINGANGSLIWDYFPYSVNPADSGLYNFYNPQFINDVNNDSFPDILVCNGGDHSAPDWQTSRPPGYLMVVNGLNGDLIAKAVVPDSAETYCSPIVADIQNNGTKWILYGTGGENLGGSFWASQLSDLLNNTLTNSVELASDLSKGFIAPASICKTPDNSYDIFIQAFGGKVSKIKGSDFSTTWNYQLQGTESSAAPTIGRFSSDLNPDVFLVLFKGIAPSYNDFYQVMLDGETGQVMFKDSIGKSNYAAAAALDLDNNGLDEAVISVNYFENGHYKNKIHALDFANGLISQLGNTRAGVNLGSTPYFGDIDQDNNIDLIYSYKKDSLNPVGWKGIYLNLIELSSSIPNTGISWGSYLGTNNNGEYYSSSTDCGPGSVISNASIIQPSCNGFADGSINLTLVNGGGPHTYLWSTGSTSSSLQNLSAGNYWVQVTNSLDCFEIRNFTLIDPFVISFGGIMSPTCPEDENGAAVVNSSGCQCMFSTCTFLWENGITTKPNNNLVEGWNSVIITHANGCLVTDSVFVPFSAPVIDSSFIGNVLCNNGATGYIQVFDGPMSTSVIYNWSNGFSTNTITDLIAGTYQLIAEDTRVCIDTLEFIVAEPDNFLIDLEGIDVLCNGESNGSILTSASGGTAPYIIFLNNQIIEPDQLNQLPTGDYEIYGVDSHGCMSPTSQITLDEPLGLSNTFTVTLASAINSFDGSIFSAVEGGTPPYSFIWEGQQSTESTIVYLNPGWYSLTILDSNDCEYSDSVYLGLLNTNELSESNFSVYPNPAINEININGINGESVSFYDLNGKLLAKHKFTANQKIDFLAKGIYYIEVKTAERTYYSKFLKE